MGRLSLAALTLFAIVLILGAVAPATAPVTVTTPVSASMEPTAPEHALVIVVSGSPAVGDIALYETPTRSDPVLHRLVDRTDDGTAFLTQGDGNHRTDQAAGEPPVQHEQIYGVVPTIAGQPLIVPYAGLVLTNPVLVVGLWALLALSALYSTPIGQVVRGTVVSVPFRSYAIVLGTLIVVVVPVVILTTPTVYETYVITSTTAPPEATQIAAPGETTAHSSTLVSPLLAAFHVSAHADGDIAVTGVDSTLGSDTVTITVQNTPSETPAIHEGTVTMYTYPMTLPESTIHTLATIHPALAAFASALVLGGPILLLGLLSDPKQIVRASVDSIYETRRDRSDEDRWGEYR